MKLLTNPETWHFIDPKREPLGFPGEGYRVAYCNVFFLPHNRHSRMKQCSICLKKVTNLTEAEWITEWKTAKSSGVISIIDVNNSTEKQEQPVIVCEASFNKKHQSEDKQLVFELFKFGLGDAKTSVRELVVNRVQQYKFAPPNVFSFFGKRSNSSFPSYSSKIEPIIMTNSDLDLWEY